VVADGPRLTEDAVTGDARLSSCHVEIDFVVVVVVVAQQRRRRVCDNVNISVVGRSVVVAIFAPLARLFGEFVSIGFDVLGMIDKRLIIATPQTLKKSPHAVAMLLKPLCHSKFTELHF